MKIGEFFRQKKSVVSFEFFPAKTEEAEKNLLATIDSLKKLEPSFVSITYGAGGTTRTKTIQLVTKIKKETGLETMAHLACGGHTKDEIHGILQELKDGGIESILALRGDPPQGQATFAPVKNGFRNAFELVSFIKKNFSFGIGVAGYPEKHPEAVSLEADLKHLKEKVDAGADVVITQLFFNNPDYFSFVEKAHKAGIRVPIVSGIMPIKDVDQIKRFTNVCGAKIPGVLMQQLESVKSDPIKVVEIGIRYATEQCIALLKGGAPGIHFYTLNKSESTREIFLRLKAAQLVP